jgi:hypothetical protein
LPPRRFQRSRGRRTWSQPATTAPAIHSATSRVAYTPVRD